MKIRFLFFLSVLITVVPAASFGATISDCDTDTIECTCPNSTETYDSLDTIDDTDDCQDTCTYYATEDDAITGFNLECKISGTVTTVGQGTLDEIGSATEEIGFENPQLSVEIPGLEFTPAFDSGGNTVVSNYLGEYIQAVYNWLIPAASLLAVVMLMIAGLQWTLARGDSGKISKAKDRMRNATVGLVLLLGAYSIAYFVDPNLLTFESLEITVIDPVEYVNESPDLPDSVAAASGGDPSIDVNSIPGDMICDSSASLKDIAYSSVGDVSYRYGGKGGPPPYPSDTKTCEEGPCKDYCPTGTICLDCSGYVNFIRTCAGLPAAGESGGTSEIFNSSAEVISGWDGSNSINGKELMPGDMIGRPGNHVLIYIGDGEVADSHGSGRAAGQAIGIYKLSFPMNDLWEGETVYLRRRN